MTVLPFKKKLIFPGFYKNNLGHVLEDIILIELLTRVPIILEKACVTLSMGASYLKSKELVNEYLFTKDNQVLKGISS